MLRTHGQRWDTDIQRLTSIYPGPDPVRLRFYSDSPSISETLVQLDDSYTPQDLENRELVYTYRIQHESAQGVNDGEIELWLWDATAGVSLGHNIRTGIRVDHHSTRDITFPTVMRSPLYDMSEYFWDILIWGDRQ